MKQKFLMLSLVCVSMTLWGSSANAFFWHEDWEHIESPYEAPLSSSDEGIPPEVHSTDPAEASPKGMKLEDCVKLLASEAEPTEEEMELRFQCCEDYHTPPKRTLDGCDMDESESSNYGW